jgi:hypothetical protein
MLCGLELEAFQALSYSNPTLKPLIYYCYSFQETVEYYKAAFFTQTSERDDAVHQMTKYVLGRERKGEFLRFIDQVTENGTGNY